MSNAHGKLFTTGVQKVDLQPASNASPDHVALDETVIQINGQQFWLYAVLRTQSVLIGCTRAIVIVESSEQLAVVDEIRVSQSDCEMTYDDVFVYMRLLECGVLELLLPTFAPAITIEINSMYSL